MNEWAIGACVVGAIVAGVAIGIGLSIKFVVDFFENLSG